MTVRARNTRLFLLSTTLILGATASHAAFAQATNKTAAAGDGSEGAELTTVIVTAESKKAAANAPSKAPLTETQPQSVISSHFIDESTPETGNWSTVVLVAPSVSGITTNGGGIGEYNKSNIRGFADGQFNMTYDGVSFGDTNDPTHHSGSYFPSSTIGAAVVDRGPGVAGDLGQANYGGALHFFSPAVSDHYAFTGKATIGSFHTTDYVGSLQTGYLPQLGGIKAWISVEEHKSNGELSNSGGNAENETIKIVKDFSDSLSLTVFSSHEFTKFNLADGGPGETWQQEQVMGKDFALNTNPKTEWCACWNYEKKQTDFEYVLLKDKLSSSMTFENQAYTYFYSNKTLAASAITDIINPDGTMASNKQDAINYTKDVSVLGATTAAADGYGANDLSGYHKGNKYRVFGDIVRFNKDWSFGTLRLGGDVETSATTRWNELYDLNNGLIDYKYTAVTASPKQAPGLVTNYPATNDKTFEGSDWAQYQVFGDFVWRPTSTLTITPGVKYYDFTRKIKALWDSIDGFSSPYNHGSFEGKSKYTKALKFLTANYRITPDWSTYAQYGESFLTPSLSTLQQPLPSENSSKPSFAVSEQLGTVFSRNAVTADVDVYKVNISNLYVPSTVPSADGDPAGSYYINAGNVHYSGVEGQAAYSFDFGLNLFVNGSLNSVKTLNGAAPIFNAPKWTDAFGGSYRHGPWETTLTFKEVGRAYAYVASSALVTPDGVSLAAGQVRELKSYNVLNLTTAYAFTRNVRLKLSGFNLADHRSIVGISGTGSATDLYSFQAGREVQATLEVKF